MNYINKYVEENTKLRDYFPFTSKDCDICIDSDAFKRISTILNGSFIRSNSPSDGQLGMIISEEAFTPLQILIERLSGVRDEYGQEDHFLRVESLLKSNVLTIPPKYLSSLPTIVKENVKYFVKLN
jgi:hypothetical protein